MKIVNEEIQVVIDGKIMARCQVQVILSWYLYPLIFVKDKSFLLNTPELFHQQGLAQIDLPHVQQKNWWKCFCQWRKYRDKYVIPFVANLEYKRQTGHFANSTVSYQLSEFK